MFEDARRRAQHQYWVCRTAAGKMDISPTFSHCTAVEYWGSPVPEDCALSRESLHISFSQRNRRRIFDGVKTHVWGGAFQLSHPGRGDFAVASPAMTWAQMAWYCSEEGLAVLAGSFACRDSQRRVTDLDEIRRYVADNPKFKGRRKCLAIMPYISDNADSPPESVLYVLVTRYLLGVPVSNFQIDLPSGGHFLIDVAYPELKLGIEYQGSYHAFPEQMRADMKRLNLLRALGWDMIFVTADDLRTDGTRQDLIAMIRDRMNRQRSLIGLARLIA